MADVISLPVSNPPASARPTSISPTVLEKIKDDLGIPLEDTTNDAWLVRRGENIWSHFEAYTNRTLAVPISAFIDDWSLVSQSQAYDALPLPYPPIGSPFLRVVPVVEVTAIELHGQAGDPTLVRFEAGSGKLFTLDSQQEGHDLTQELRQGASRITYRAGWSVPPGDLYEALLGVLQPLWAARQAASSGSGVAGLGTITSVSLTDVGQVEIGAGNMFVNATMKGVGTTNPLIGPWVNILDAYKDFRVAIGSPLIPVTRPTV